MKLIEKSPYIVILTDVTVDDCKQVEEMLLARESLVSSEFGIETPDVESFYEKEKEEEKKEEEKAKEENEEEEESESDSTKEHNA